MPRIDNFSKGIALGIGIAVLVPVALTTLAPVIKPVARGALKTGIRAIEKGREIIAETTEAVEDIVAETQAELRSEFMNSPGDEASMVDDTSATVEENVDAASSDEFQDNIRNVH